MTSTGRQAHPFPMFALDLCFLQKLQLVQRVHAVILELGGMKATQLAIALKLDSFVENI